MCSNKSGGIVATLNLQVSSISDDGAGNNEESTFEIDTLGSSLYVGDDWEFTDYIGLRFLTNNIPKNCEIISAKLRLKGKYNVGVNTVATIIKGIDEDNTNTFLADPFESWEDFIARQTTDNEVAWNVPAVVIEEWYETPDLKDIVQEIVDRENWQENNAIGFVISSNDGTGNNDSRGFSAYDDGSEDAPTLIIEYTPVSQTFESSDIWTAPAGVTQVTVTARAGGAAGSPNGSNNARAGGGGGGGAYTKGTIDVTPGNTYNVTVGAAVTSGNGQLSRVIGDSLTVAANGGLTSINRIGGAGGAAVTGGNIIASYKGGNGGTASNSNNQGGGGGGEGGCSDKAGGNGLANVGTTGGAGGTGGDGGDGGKGGNNSQAGTGGTIRGGGGGGAGGNNNTQGAGARGEVLLEWSVSVEDTNKMFQLF